MAQLNQRKKNSVKWLLYIFSLFLAFILQTTVGFFQVFGVKPIFILPVMVYISMFEGELAGAVIGIVGGLFWDTAADKLLGFNYYDGDMCQRGFAGHVSGSGECMECPSFCFCGGIASGFDRLFFLLSYLGL